MLRFRRPLVILPILLVLSMLPAQPAAAQTGERCFAETNLCISGRIREFWEANGGLPVFGLPIAPQQATTIEGRSLQVQQFERNRLELHPNNPRPNDVLLGRLGADRLAQQGRDWQTAFPKETPQAGCRFFPETGHNACGAILSAWRASGTEIDGRAGKTEAENLSLFGLPLSGLISEMLSDGKSYQVQYFERARFELHPENQPPFNVLLGLLGRETSGGGTPPPAATDQCADVREPVSGRIRPGKCVVEGTVIELDVFGFQPNEQIGFWLTAPDGRRAGTTQTTNVGLSGGANGLPFPTDELDPGIWYWVFQGVNSGHQSIIYFKVLPRPGGSTPPPPATNQPLPPAQNASAQPERGARGTVFTFAARGFQPGENVGVYITAPDRSVIGAPFQIVTDGAGNAEQVTFRSQSDFPVGIYAITFEGVSSGRKAIAYFEVQ